MKRLLVLGLFVMCMFALGQPAVAVDFPKDSIIYSIPFNPGGLSDLTARYQQPRLEKVLGVKVVMQYKPGGGGSVGWAELIKKKPDGYFISGINIPHIVLQPLARGKAGYKTEELLPVCLFQDTPIGIAVLKTSPLKTLQEFIDFAKKNAGAITCSGSGTWSGNHISHLMFQKAAGINITYVPYKGGAPSAAAFLGGHVMARWVSSSEAVQHKEKTRLLAIGADKRLADFPDAPTFEELGFDIKTSIARGVGVPPGTPSDRIRILEDAFRKVATDPEVMAHFAKEGYVNLFLGSEESKAYIRERVSVMKPLVKEFKK